MREGSVALLIADLAGSTAMYEQLGDEAAKKQVTDCLARLGEATGDHDGRVVKTLGDGVLCVFPAVESALRAAIRMRRDAREQGLVLRAGVHFGLVADDESGDVFGDAVNTVARVSDVATHAEILVTHEVYRQLSSDRALQLQPLPPVALKGKREPVQLYTLPASRGGSSTLADDHDEAVLGSANAQLVLGYGAKEWACREQTLVLGRSRECDVVLATARASRAHAKVFRLGANFYLADTSSNGTWLVTGDLPPFRLHRERSPLIGAGRIYCGAAPKAEEDGSNAVTYRVED